VRLSPPLLLTYFVSALATGAAGAGVVFQVSIRIDAAIQAGSSASIYDLQQAVDLVLQNNFGAIAGNPADSNTNITVPPPVTPTPTPGTPTPTPSPVSP
jgi:hypothetical protein